MATFILRQILCSYQENLQTNFVLSATVPQKQLVSVCFPGDALNNLRKGISADALCWTGQMSGDRVVAAVAVAIGHLPAMLNPTPKCSRLNAVLRI